MITTDATSDPEAAEETPAEPMSVTHYLWQTVSWLLLAAAFAILCATILVPKVSGAQPYTVLTGSMRPSYPPGTLIVVKRVNPDSLAVGDVVTYQIRSGDPEVVTHRIVEITTAPDGDRRFITRGDANNTDDEPAVRPVQIRGKLWYSIPHLGFVNTWFTGVKRTVVVFVLAGLLFAYGAWQFYCDWRDDRHEKAEDEVAAGSADDTATAGSADEAPTVSFPAIVDTEAVPAQGKAADQ